MLHLAGFFFCYIQIVFGNFSFKFKFLIGQVLIHYTQGQELALGLRLNCHSLSREQRSFFRLSSMLLKWDHEQMAVILKTVFSKFVSNRNISDLRPSSCEHNVWGKWLFHNLEQFSISLWLFNNLRLFWYIGSLPLMMLEAFIKCDRFRSQSVLIFTEVNWEFTTWLFEIVLVECNIPNKLLPLICRRKRFK